MMAEEIENKCWESFSYLIVILELSYSIHSCFCLSRLWLTYLGLDLKRYYCFHDEHDFLKVFVLRWHFKNHRSHLILQNLSFFSSLSETFSSSSDEALLATWCIISSSSRSQSRGAWRHRLYAIVAYADQSIINGHICKKKKNFISTDTYLRVKCTLKNKKNVQKILKNFTKNDAMVTRGQPDPSVSAWDFRLTLLHSRHATHGSTPL